MTRKRCTVNLLAVAAIAFSLAAPDTVAFNLYTSDGTGADSYVQGNTSTANFGNSTALLTQFALTRDFSRKTYLRFDLSTLPTGVDGVDVQSLKRTIDNITPGEDPLKQVYVYGLNDGHAGESWVEGDGGTDNSPAGEITWDNAPGNDTVSGSAVLSAETALLYTTLFNSTETELVVPGENLLSFIAADTDNLVTFIITYERLSIHGGGAIKFASKEHQTLEAPLLFFIPEPAAGSLLLMAGLLLWRRWGKSVE